MFKALTALCLAASLLTSASSAALPAVFGVPYPSETDYTYSHPNTALLIVDVQYDFINGSLIIATSQDWHPEGHVSFASAHPRHEPGDVIQIPVLASRYKETARQSLTYDHCVPGTFGANIEEGVQSRLNSIMGKTPITQIHKAQHHLNQYFEFTTLGPEMRARDIEEIVIVGLVTTACVYGSTVDGIKMGWDVTVISDGVEASTQEKQDTALEELATWWGAKVTSLSDFEAASSCLHNMRSGNYGIVTIMLS
ncbi:Isochorismatase-like protein [Mucidula mucida]|nr:Isochorismatase-like protein [Mucidula mucida]